MTELRVLVSSSGTVEVSDATVEAALDATTLRVRSRQVRDVVVYGDGRFLARARGAEVDFDVASVFEARDHPWDAAAYAAAVAAEEARPVRHRYEIVPDPPVADEPVALVVHARPGTVSGVRATAGDAAADGAAVGGDEWHVMLPGQAAGTTLRWKVDYRDTVGEWHPVADAAPAYTRPRPSLVYVRPPRHQFSVRVAPPHVPDWAWDAVIYHLLVDRFARSDGSRVADAASLEEMGFLGGTIAGATRRLDHVVDLGVNTVLLSPVTPGEMHCTYDVKDLTAVEPRFGTIEDLRRFCAAAHDGGVRVLLDVELSYLGARHPMAHPPWVHATNGRLWGWIGGNPMFRPVDHFHPHARAALLDSLPFWLDLGVDGFRFDSAHSAPPDFWTDVGARIAAHNPDAFTFGEVTAGPREQELLRGRLHGYLDFATEHALRAVASFGVPPSDTGGIVGTGPRIERPAAALAAAAADAAPRDPYACRIAFVESHDDARIDLVVGHDESRVRFALELLTLLPGPPLLLYGTEVGLGQPAPGSLDKAVRGAMPWGAVDEDSLAAVRGFIARRHKHPALRRGDFTLVTADDEAGRLAFRRACDGEVVEVVADAASASIAITAPGE